MRPMVLALPLLLATMSNAEGQEPVRRAEAQEDSVILRITSNRGEEARFSGTISFDGARAPIELKNALTPYELKLPHQILRASVTADDAGVLAGEIIRMKQGEIVGHVQGHTWLGAVKLYNEPGKSFGFGSTSHRERSLP